MPYAAPPSRVTGPRPFKLDVATISAILQRIAAERSAFAVTRIIGDANGAAASGRGEASAIADSAGFAGGQRRSDYRQDDQ